MVVYLSSPTPTNTAQFLSFPTHCHSTTAPKFGSQETLLLLQKCSKFTHLKLIQAKIFRHNLSDDQLLTRKLLHLCFSFQKIHYATLIFDQIENPDTFTWNFIIRAYTTNGSSQQALLLYNLMISRGFKPDKFTFPFVIKSCLTYSTLDKGKEVHGFAIKTGFWNDTFLHNTLMDLYFKCGDLENARKVFDKMRVRSVVSWTTFVAGLVASGELDAARVVFDKMPIRNVVSWTAMINGYVKNGQVEEAFELFRKMQLDNVRPNAFTLVGLIRACTELGSLELGKWVHEYALKNEFKLGIFLGTALIDMYSKCGSLDDAKKVFDEMQIKNVATWNSMITSLGVHGYGEEALALFAWMEKMSVWPDAITFVGVLCACVQINSSVKKAEWYFKLMKENYEITPIVEHYACMIEIYTRPIRLSMSIDSSSGTLVEFHGLCLAILWSLILAENESIYTNLLQYYFL